MKPRKDSQVNKKIDFAWQTSQEIDEYVRKNALILLPVGQTEQHGRHLPLNTDFCIAENIARALAERIKEEIPVLVMPPVWSGYSTREVKRWPGTISLSPDTFMDMVFQICGSLIQMGFRKIVLISCHGNHTGALEVAVRRIADAYGVYMALTVPTILAKDRISSIIETEDIHGGEYETSLMLYLAEDSVEKGKFTDVDRVKIGYGFRGKAFVSTWGLQKSRTGIYGETMKSSREKGARLLESVVEQYLEFLKEFYYLKERKNTK